MVAYEIDRRLEPVLDETLAGCDNVRVVFRDICDVTDDELADAAGSDYILAANLPYYITTPILFRFTECARPPRTMIVMVQKEVADRLTAAPGTPAYGALTASVALTYEARITRFVPRSLFTPVPNVDSAVVRLSFSPKCDEPRTRTRAHPGGVPHAPQDAGQQPRRRRSPRADAGRAGAVGIRSGRPGRNAVGRRLSPSVRHLTLTVTKKISVKQYTREVPPQQNTFYGQDIYKNVPLLSATERRVVCRAALQPDFFTRYACYVSLGRKRHAAVGERQHERVPLRIYRKIERVPRTPATGPR